MFQGTLFVDIALTVTATLLTFFSVTALRSLVRVKAQSTMWIPVLVSGAFFLYGSVARFIFQVCLIQSPQLLVASELVNTLHGISWLIGLMVLTYGIFAYSQAAKNIVE